MARPTFPAAGLLSSRICSHRSAGYVDTSPICPVSDSVFLASLVLRRFFFPVRRERRLRVCSREESRAMSGDGLFMSGYGKCPILDIGRCVTA